MKYWSAAEPGFYDPQTHTRIPDDAVPMSAKEYAALQRDLAPGQRIVVGADGRPAIADPPPPPDHQVAAIVRGERDRRIADLAWRYERHARELRLGLPPTDDLTALDDYIQALADVPEQAGFPHTVDWPTPPV